VSAPIDARRTLAALAEGLIATGVALWLALRLGSPLAWLAVPLVLSWLHRTPGQDYGLEPRFTPPSFRAHLALGSTLLLLYAAAHTAIASWLFDQTLTPALPPRLGHEIFRQLVLTAIPEELFFRGYLESRWNEAFGRPWRVYGARVGPALVGQAVVFGICHLATGDWTRLRVFFFALLAGWLRERSGSILAPVVYHAVANVWVQVLASSLR
jgi:hypothetical protein